jgi:hypothetical protein
MDSSTSPSVVVAPRPNARRRRFLFVIGAGVTGAATAGTIPAVTAIAPLAAPEGARRSSGYRVSEHVRDYYQSARR